MEEKLVFMQVEDMMVTLEKENGETIIYPIVFVPQDYKEGDIIKVKIHLDWIEFIELDSEEMKLRKEKIADKKVSIKERAKRSTN